jgi:hypothetical protein
MCSEITVAGSEDEGTATSTAESSALSTTGSQRCGNNEADWSCGLRTLRTLWRSCRWLSATKQLLSYGNHSLVEDNEETDCCVQLIAEFFSVWELYVDRAVQPE